LNIVSYLALVVSDVFFPTQTFSENKHPTFYQHKIFFLISYKEKRTGKWIRRYLYHLSFCNIVFKKRNWDSFFQYRKPRLVKMISVSPFHNATSHFSFFGHKPLLPILIYACTSNLYKMYVQHAKLSKCYIHLEFWFVLPIPLMNVNML
jgi:hypothetical protein